MLLKCGVGEDSRVPWTVRRSNQVILKEISPEYSLEGLMLKLNLQNFGHLMWRADSFERILILGKIEGGRRRRWQRMRCLDGITNSMAWVWVNSGIWRWTGKCGMLKSMRSQSQTTEQLNWTELNWNHIWLIHSFMSGRCGCLHILSTESNAIMNTGI